MTNSGRKLHNEKLCNLCVFFLFLATFLTFIAALLCFYFFLPFTFLIFNMPRSALGPSQPPAQGILDSVFRGKLAGA